MSIDPLRHLSVFSPQDHLTEPIHIIGCGATGSRIAMSLAKLGLENLHLWDFDTVMEHNIANQLFEQKHIGEAKVNALMELIEAATGVKVTTHEVPVTGETTLSGVVFVLTDTMKSRKEIWDGAIRLKLPIRLMIETRMGASEGRVYTVQPTSVDDIRGWEATLYEDKDAEVSACGASITVGPTAETLSGIAVWQYIRQCNYEKRKEGYERPESEVLFALNPPMIMTRRFKS